MIGQRFSWPRRYLWQAPSPPPPPLLGFSHLPPPFHKYPPPGALTPRSFPLTDPPPPRPRPALRWERRGGRRAPRRVRVGRARTPHPPRKAEGDHAQPPAT